MKTLVHQCTNLKVYTLSHQKPVKIVTNGRNDTVTFPLSAIVFKFAVLTYPVLCADASLYFQPFICTTDITSRQRLWSSTTDSLSGPAVRLSTVGRRTFPVAVT